MDKSRNQLWFYIRFNLNWLNLHFNKRNETLKMYYSLLIGRTVHSYLANNEEGTWADHYTSYPSIWSPSTHLQNHDSTSFVSEQKQEEKRDLSSSTCILWAEETTRQACRVMLFSTLISATFFTVLVHHKIGGKGGRSVSHKTRYTSFISASVNLSSKSWQNGRL